MVRLNEFMGIVPIKYLEWHSLRSFNICIITSFITAMMIREGHTGCS
jgi:hypothetical protein